MAMSKKKEETFSLVPGSYYLIRSAEARDHPLETRGKFRGYASIGQDSALAIEMDEPGENKGRLRFIPLPMVLSVDVLKAIEKPDEPKEQPEGVYFG